MNEKKNEESNAAAADRITPLLVVLSIAPVGTVQSPPTKNSHIQFIALASEIERGQMRTSKSPIRYSILPPFRTICSDDFFISFNFHQKHVTNTFSLAD